MLSVTAHSAGLSLINIVSQALLPTIMTLVIDGDLAIMTDWSDDRAL